MEDILNKLNKLNGQQLKEVNDFIDKFEIFESNDDEKEMNNELIEFITVELLETNNDEEYTINKKIYDKYKNIIDSLQILKFEHVDDEIDNYVYSSVLIGNYNLELHYSYLYGRYKTYQESDYIRINGEQIFEHFIFGNNGSFETIYDDIKNILPKSLKSEKDLLKIMLIMTRFFSGFIY